MRPRKGYSANRKLKDATKSLKHATEINNETRKVFWDEYIKTHTVIKEKKKNK